MSTLDAFISRTLADPLLHVRGRDGIGYVGLDVPPDLLLTPQRPGCHLPWDLGGATPRADQWLESSFPAWARSILESWAQGRFDVLRQVVFTRGEDVSQRLYYYVCELQRQGRIAGPAPLIFDVARIARDSSRRYTVAALRQLSQELGLDATALRQGMVRANALRGRFAALRAERTGPGSLYERIVRTSLFTDLTDPLENFIPPRANAGRGRVLLLGSVPPDDRLHQMVEAQGWTVVNEVNDRALDRLGSALDPDSADAVDAVARGWLGHEFLAHDNAHSVARVQTTLRAARPDAVIGWYAREDEGLAWQVPLFERAVRASGLPTLTLCARAGDLGDGVGEEVRIFLKALQR